MVAVVTADEVTDWDRRWAVRIVAWFDRSAPVGHVSEADSRRPQRQVLAASRLKPTVDNGSFTTTLREAEPHTVSSVGVGLAIDEDATPTLRTPLLSNKGDNTYQIEAGCNLRIAGVHAYAKLHLNHD